MPAENANLGAGAENGTSTGIEEVTGGGTGSEVLGSEQDTEQIVPGSEESDGTEVDSTTEIKVEDFDDEALSDSMPNDLRAFIKQDPAAAPHIQRLWDRLANYASIFPTPREARDFRDMFPGGIEDAKSLTEKAGELDRSNELIYSGDPAQQMEVLQPMYEDNPEAFMGLIKTATDLISKRDPQGFQAFTGEIISDHLQSQKFGEHLEAMGSALEGLSSADENTRKEALNNLANLTGRLLGWGKKSGYVGKERDLGRVDISRPDPKYKALENENKTLRQNQWNSFSTSVNTATKPKIEATIRKLIEPAMKGVPEKQRKVTTDMLVRNASAELEGRLKTDQLFQRQYQEWAKARTFPSADKATQFIVGRAQAHVKAVVKSILDPWGKTFVDDKNAVGDKTTATGTRVDVTGATNTGGRNIKNKLTQEEANGLKPDAILDWSRKQYEKRQASR